MNENKDKPEIDLGRMQRLLDGFNYDEKEQERLKQKKYKSFCDLLKEEDQISVNSEDLCMMFNEHGRISGYSHQVKVEDLYDEIVSNINIDDLQTSKAIAILFFMNQKHHSMLELSDVLEKIYELLPQEILVNFGSYLTNSVEPGYLEYRVILTGSTRTDDLSQKFNHFVFDEYIFEISDYFLSLNNHTTLEATQFFEIGKIDGITINKNNSNHHHIAINILTNGFMHEIFIINTEKNIATFNSMIRYLLKYKRAIKK